MAACAPMRCSTPKFATYSVVHSRTYSRSAVVQSPPTVFDSVSECVRAGWATVKAVAHQPPIDGPTRRARCARRIENCGHVGDRRRAAVHTGGERRVAEAAAVPRDHTESVGCERRHLLEPRGMRAAGAVCEHDCGQIVVAADFVIDLFAAARD